MARYRTHNRTHNPNIAAVINRAAPPIAYLCKLAHDMPHTPTLEQLHKRDLSAYIPSIKGSAVTCAEGAITMVTIARGKLTLSNVPTGITSYNAMLGYHSLINERNITILTRIHAFTIYTTPHDAYLRGCNYLNATMLPEALIEFDTAINESAALLDSQEITDALERSFSRYCKLRNLFFYNPEPHERKLALQRALRQAALVWTTIHDDHASREKEPHNG